MALPFGSHERLAWATRWTVWAGSTGDMGSATQFLQEWQDTKKYLEANPEEARRPGQHKLVGAESAANSPPEWSNSLGMPKL